MTTCTECRTPFTPARADAAYCSSACRQRAYRKRKQPKAKPTRNAPRVTAKRDAEFETRVQAEVQARLGLAFTQTQAEYRRVLNARKGILTRAHYDLIRSCLHPDSRESVSDRKLANAFRVFNESDILLLSEKERPTTQLPSLDDLLKRRK